MIDERTATLAGSVWESFDRNFRMNRVPLTLPVSESFPSEGESTGKASGTRKANC